MSSLNEFRVFRQPLRQALVTSILLATAGCAQTSVKYLSSSDYDRAVILFDNGLLPEARQKVQSIPKDDPSYGAAARLLSDINDLSIQVSRRHLALADDYEKAGAYAAALSEYNTVLMYSSSNQYAMQRAAFLTEALKEGRRPDLEQTRTASQKKKGRRDDRDDREYAEAHYSKGKVYLDAKAYAKAIEELTVALKYSPNYRDARQLLSSAVKDRDVAAQEHIKKGITFFQAEELDLAIREWDFALEIDPDNEMAADYRRRAEVILERLKNIRERQGGRSPS